MFEVRGDRPQPLLWEEHGFRMYIPEGALSPTDTCLVSVQAIVAGLFLFPEGTEPVSAIYAVSLSRKFDKPVKLELQHCVLLEKPGQSKFMSFAFASHDQSSPPYQFQPLDGSNFQPNSFYGSIDREQFSFISIIWRYLFGKDSCEIPPALISHLVFHI